MRMTWRSPVIGGSQEGRSAISTGNASASQQIRAPCIILECRPLQWSAAGRPSERQV